MLHNIKKVKILGKGYLGTTYLVKKDGVEYALKVTKILPSEMVKSMKLKLWLELDFYEFIDQLDKYDIKFFVKLYAYEFHKCNHIQERICHNIKEIERMKPYDDSKWCMYKLLELKGETLVNYNINNKLSKKHIYCMIIQFAYISSILKSNTYTHNDLHSENITVQKSDNPIIKYKKKRYNLPINIQLSIIDYDSVVSKEHNKRKLFVKYPEIVYYNEMFKPIWYIILKNDKLIFDCKKQDNILPWNRDKKKYTNNKVLNEFMTNHPKLWNEKKEKIIKRYKGSAKYIENFEKNKMIDISYIKNVNNCIGRIAMNSMAEYFGIHYPKRYGEIYGWCSYHKPYFAKKELLELFEYTTTDQIIKHCLLKLKLLEK